jgi:hypothetical protein
MDQKLFRVVVSADFKKADLDATAVNGSKVRIADLGAWRGERQLPALRAGGRFRP